MPSTIESSENFVLAPLAPTLIAMRSKLFVPGSRPELFEKALSGEADALSFDLEDSVVDARKAQAREALRGLLRAPATRSSSKVLIVRVNAFDSPPLCRRRSSSCAAGLDTAQPAQSRTATRCGRGGARHRARRTQQRLQARH